MIVFLNLLIAFLILLIVFLCVIISLSLLVSFYLPEKRSEYEPSVRLQLLDYRWATACKHPDGFWQVVQEDLPIDDYDVGN